MLTANGCFNLGFIMLLWIVFFEELFKKSLFLRFSSKTEEHYSKFVLIAGENSFLTLTSVLSIDKGKSLSKPTILTS